MRIALVDARPPGRCVLKDVAGGFGTAFRVGRSLPARLLERAKSRIAALPHVTLAYLDALCTAAGADVDVLELERPEAPVAADLYLVASSIVACGLERRIARAARARGARVGVFGTFAGRRPEVYDDVADFVVRGEIEVLAAELARGARPRGLVEAGFVEDLDALPFPRWDRFDVSRFRYRIVTSRGITLPVLGSRGCAYGCDYCPYLVDSRFRTRGLGSLVDEIVTMADRHGARGFSFRDPLRLFDHDEASALADALARRDLDVRFSMECRSDRLDEVLLERLHRAGLRSLEMGIESHDRSTVAARGRRPPATGHQERVIAHCHRLGIRVIANYMLGLPNDTEDGMRETIRYAKRLNTFAVQFTVATPYPGTRLYDEVADRLAPGDWERFDGWTNVFRHPTMSAAAIHGLRERAYLGYHLRPRYLWRLMRSLPGD